MRLRRLTKSQLKRQQDEEAMRQQARQEVEADKDKSIEEERLAIEEGCKKLKVRVKEIEPDGHWCVATRQSLALALTRVHVPSMYNAIADQLNSLKLSSSVRCSASRGRLRPDWSAARLGLKRTRQPAHALQTTCVNTKTSSCPSSRQKTRTRPS